jgi:hypothetical protein
MILLVVRLGGILLHKIEEARDLLRSVLRIKVRGLICKPAGLIGFGSHTLDTGPVLFSERCRQPQATGPRVFHPISVDSCRMIYGFV